MAILEQWDLGNLGVSLVVHSLAVFYAHAVLLTGENLRLWKADKNSKMPTPNLGFFRLMLLFFGFALAAGFGFAFGMSVSTERQMGVLVIVVLIAFWASLSLFGMVLPRSVYRSALKRNADDKLVGLGGQVGFIAVWIAVYTLLFVVLVVGPLLYLMYLANDDWAILALGTVLGILTYLPTCLTASVLSHAFLRANNLPLQGLITRV